MTQEIWKDIKEYEGLYQVSNLGRVRSCKREIKMRNQFTGIEYYLNPWTDNKGYKRADLMKNGKKKSKQVHRLVAEAFIENPYNKPQVNHIDGNPKNNNVSNLEWNTAKENSQHAIRTGLKVRTRAIPVIQLSKEGDFIKTWKSIALAQKQLNITNGKISECCKGKRKTTGGYKWKYAKEE